MSSRINRETALERMGGDDSLYERLQGYFLRDYSDFLERVSSLISSQDPEAYVLTHSLKNIAASLGADELAKRALALELCLKQEDFASASRHLSDIGGEFESTLKELGEVYREDDSLVGVEHGHGTEGAEDIDLFELLNLLAEGLGSFSPAKVNEAVAQVKSYWMVIPPVHRDQVREVLSLAKEYRYLDGEERVKSLLETVN